MQYFKSMKLPPLNAMKSFEATVRLGSFKAAAIELNVSPSAVSLQVKNAESFFGKTLFERRNNSLVLTDAGHMLYPPVSQALRGLASITEQFLENAPKQRFVISTLQSIAEKWVIPAVIGLRSDNPVLGIDVLIQDDPVDFTKDRIDIRLTHSTQVYQRMQNIFLRQDSVVPLCAPAFAQACGHDFARVPDSALIHVDWGERFASYPTWAAWFRHAGRPRYPDVTKGVRVAGAALAVALAEQGGGVALCPALMTQAALDSGQLMQFHPYRIKLPYALCAIVHSDWPSQGSHSKHIQQLIDALKTP